MPPQTSDQHVAAVLRSGRTGWRAPLLIAAGLFALVPHAGRAEASKPVHPNGAAAAIPLPPARPRPPLTDEQAAQPLLPPRRPPDLGQQAVAFGPDLPQPTVGPGPRPHTPVDPPPPNPASIPLTQPALASPAAPLPPLPDEVAAAELVCANLFSSGKVVARAIAPVPGSNGCGIVAPIELSAVLTASKRKIEFRPPVTINCPLGEAVADWLRADVDPLFDKSGKSLQALASTSGYSCRGRNQIVGAKLSEHGKGNAMDIGGFLPAGGSVIGVKDPKAPEMLSDIKATACARFMTVLGPGSDGYHESHMHVDLAPRRSGRKLCQWDLPDAVGPAQAH